MKQLALLMAVVAAPVAAQAPAGWTYRLDGAPTPPKSGAVVAGEWAYQRMPPGWHLTTTDQGVTVYPEVPRPMSGEWGVETEFFLFPDPSESGVGVALMATTSEEHQGELRLLLRRDGQVSVEVRGSDGVETLMPWTADTAAAAHNGSETKRYVLRVMHQGEKMTVAVNGREMLAIPIGPNVQTPYAGFRAGPGLNLHISRFDLITPLAPPRP